MKDKKYFFKKDELVKGSLVLFIMINLFNLLNYIFQFSMARMLTAGDYGVLAVLMSLIYIFSVPYEAIQNIMTKYTSKFNSLKQDGKIKYLMKRALRKGFLFAVISYIIFIPIALFLSYFLNIDFWLFLITGLIIFSCFCFPILRGVLQGKKNFYSFGVNMILEGIFKLVFAILLVSFGLKVYGAMFAVIIGTLIPFVIAFSLLKNIREKKEIKTEFKGIYSYSAYFFIATLAIVLMYSLDVIFAKRFFPADIVGKYAVVSMLGKAIFFFTLAISKAMFPIVSEKNEIGEKTYYLLKKSMKIVGLICGIILLIYILFSSKIINLFFGEKYAELSNMLFLIGLSYSFLAFSNLFILYKFSINSIRKSSFILLLFVVLQIMLFFAFHNTIKQFCISLLISNIVMFLYSLLLVKK